MFIAQKMLCCLHIICRTKTWHHCSSILEINATAETRVLELRSPPVFVTYASQTATCTAGCVLLFNNWFLHKPIALLPNAELEERRFPMQWLQTRYTEHKHQTAPMHRWCWIFFCMELLRKHVDSINIGIFYPLEYLRYACSGSVFMIVYEKSTKQGSVRSCGVTIPHSFMVFPHLMASVSTAARLKVNGQSQTSISKWSLGN